jgi:hypothetical protein
VRHEIHHALALLQREAIVGVRGPIPPRSSLSNSVSLCPVRLSRGGDWIDWQDQYAIDAFAKPRRISRVGRYGNFLAVRQPGGSAHPIEATPNGLHVARLDIDDLYAPLRPLAAGKGNAASVG